MYESCVKEPLDLKFEIYKDLLMALMEPVEVEDSDVSLLVCCL